VPVSNLIEVVDQQTVPSLVPMVEPDASTVPSAEPRLELDRVMVETVETALLGMDYDKNDLKKYRTMFEVPGSYQEAVNYHCEWQCNKLIGATGTRTPTEIYNMWTVIARSAMQPGRVFRN
jgi:hypothetical protein